MKGNRLSYKGIPEANVLFALWRSARIVDVMPAPTIVEVESDLAAWTNKPPSDGRYIIDDYRGRRIRVELDSWSNKLRGVYAYDSANGDGKAAEVIARLRGVTVAEVIAEGFEL